MQFIAFGLLHALYLCINHAWRLFRSTSKAPAVASGTVSTSSLTSYLSSAGSCLLTFSAVLLAQIFFRASSMSDAFSYLAALAGRHSASAIAAGPTAFHPARSAFALIAMGFIIVWCFPNTQQILANFKPALEVTSADRKPALISYVWRPNAAWGLVLGIIFFAAVIKMQDPSSFLYFQF